MFFWIVKILATPFLWLFFKPKIYGRKNFKTQGRIIFMCNHKSFFDPVLLDIVQSRKIIFMAKSELFKNKFIAYFLKKLGAFEVRRGEGDLGAIKYAMQVLHREKVLGIFPEGTRSREITRLEPGTVMLAFKTNSKILPIFIGGKYGLFSRTKIAVGEQVDLAEITGKKRITPQETVECLNILTSKLIKLKEICEG